MIGRRLTTLLLLLVCGPVGCVGASLAEKRASFQPYTRVQVHGVSIERYLSERTAMLLRDFEVELDTEHGGQRVLRLTPTGGDHQGFGTAAAISHDGYFLTAAHNLEGNTIHLLMQSPAGLRIGVARAVWTGDPDEPAQDFAVLKLEAFIPRCFRWAKRTQVHRGTTVFTAGCFQPCSPPAFSAGAALEAIPAPESVDGLPPTSLVIHDAPVRKGDSGGPLTTLDGKLVALNVIYAPLTGRHESVRPDPSWVKWVIGVDRLRQRRAQARTDVAARAQPQ